MKTYFPDTNLFLEFRKASDLPWHELEGATPGEASDVRLIVPSTVITEIERNKTNGNSRKAKRARDASAVLRQALLSQGHITELRAANPRVVLQLPPVVKVDFSQFPNLDPTRPDHRIAAEYAEVRKIELNLTVLSDDTLSILAVRSLGFEPILIPESWRLAPEKDGRDDEIDRLKEEAKIYKQSSPQISISVEDASDEAVKAINAKVDVFEPSKQDVDRAVAMAQTRFPMATDFGLSPPAGATLLPSTILDFGRTWRTPKAEDIEAYKTTAYPHWVDSIRNAMPALARRLNTISHQIPFKVRLWNAGFVNATDMRLTVTAYDGVTLLDSLSEEAETERQKKKTLPAPPEPPRGHYFSFTSLYGPQLMPPTIPLMRDLQSSLSPPPRDPNGFYYVDRRPSRPVEELELTCEAFPHQGEPYSLRFRMVIPDNDLGQQPRLRIRVQASNLRKPVEEYVPISAAFVRGDFIQLVSKIKFAN
jgi:hypothetical protein